MINTNELISVLEINMNIAIIIGIIIGIILSLIYIYIELRYKYNINIVKNILNSFLLIYAYIAIIFAMTILSISSIKYIKTMELTNIELSKKYFYIMCYIAFIILYAVMSINLLINLIRYRINKNKNKNKTIIKNNG